MDKAVTIITALGSIGSFIGALIALMQIVKVAAVVKFKNEKLYGTEAIERCNEIRKKRPEIDPNSFGPDEYKGGNKAIPQFETERLQFDKLTMPAEWKKYRRTMRYYYEENGKTMVRGWRL